MGSGFLLVPFRSGFERLSSSLAPRVTPREPQAPLKLWFFFRSPGHCLACDPTGLDGAATSTPLDDCCLETVLHCREVYVVGRVPQSSCFRDFVCGKCAELPLLFQPPARGATGEFKRVIYLRKSSMLFSLDFIVS